MRRPPRPRAPAAAARFAAAGLVSGAFAALVAFAPAAWLLHALASASGERIAFADPRGSVWSGSAVALLAGGAGSLDASALPGRLHWSIRPEGMGLALVARQACCIRGELRLRVAPHWGGWSITLPAGPIGQWPADWLSGLGTPFNTLRLGGTLSLTSQGLSAESAAGRWRLEGGAELAVDDLSSRLSTLPALGSYRLAISGGEVARIGLATRQGPLMMSGAGEWSSGGLHFRGEAHAAPGSESALNNLLNLLGRRHGAQVVLSIG